MIATAASAICSTARTVRALARSVALDAPRVQEGTHSGAVQGVTVRRVLAGHQTTQQVVQDSQAPPGQPVGGMRRPLEPAPSGSIPPRSWSLAASCRSAVARLGW